MDKRLLVLAAAAVVIAGLCAFRTTRTDRPTASASERAIVEPAPPFELYDQSAPSRLVRLIGYLGRNRVVVVFFDGRAGAHHSAVLRWLRDNSHRLRDAGIYVMAISAALPQENRKDAAQHGEFPFPLVSDPDFHVHRAWGRFDAATNGTREGVFLVDRKGNVAWSRDSDLPQPLDNWELTLNQLLGGD